VSGKFKPGDERINRRGRPRGTSKAELLRRAIERLEAAQAMQDKRDPLEILLELARDRTLGVTTRLRACEALLPYCHRRQPVLVEAPVDTTSDFRHLEREIIAAAEAMGAAPRNWEEALMRGTAPPPPPLALPAPVDVTSGNGSLSEH
jgi:hypothetical protein